MPSTTPAWVEDMNRLYHIPTKDMNRLWTTPGIIPTRRAALPCGMDAMVRDALNREGEAHDGFDLYDDDHSGALTTEQLRACLDDLGLFDNLDEAQAAQLLAEQFLIADVDGSGAVDYQEFVGYYNHLQGMLQQQEFAPLATCRLGLCRSALPAFKSSKRSSLQAALLASQSQLLGTPKVAHTLPTLRPSGKVHPQSLKPVQTYLSTSFGDVTPTQSFARSPPTDVDKAPTVCFVNHLQHLATRLEESAHPADLDKDVTPVQTPKLHDSPRLADLQVGTVLDTTGDGQCESIAVDTTGDHKPDKVKDIQFIIHNRSSFFIKLAPVSTAVS